MAAIADDSEIISVTITYTVDGTNYFTVNMIETQFGVYVATKPSNAIEDVTITARDIFGNENSISYTYRGLIKC